MNTGRHTSNINDNIIDNDTHPDDDNDSTDEDTVNLELAESQNEAPTECQVS